MQILLKCKSKQICFAHEQLKGTLDWTRPDTKQQLWTGGQGPNLVFSLFSTQTNRPTTRPTDRPTHRRDRWTVKASYRVACPQLKSEKKDAKYFLSFNQKKGQKQAKGNKFRGWKAKSIFPNFLFNFLWYTTLITRQNSLYIYIWKFCLLAILPIWVIAWFEVFPDLSITALGVLTCFLG